MTNMDSAKKMKIGYSKLALAVALFAVASHANAAATLIAAAVITVATYATVGTVAAIAVGIVATAVVAKSFMQSMQPSGADGAGGANSLSGSSPNTGNRQQVPPATDNKLPIVYGSAWVGGTIVDLSITENNQDLYYVIALCEVTNNGQDTIDFGDVYWGGKKCIFDATNEYKVTALRDESTGENQTNVNGYLNIYFYKNGSNQPVNTTQTAISLMQSPGLIYTWDNTKLMTNCAFAIVHITYNQDAGITGIQQTKFQVTNSRYAPGDCFYDYFTSTTYGAAVDSTQVDTASLAVLNAYCAQPFSYTDASGNPGSQARFRFDGIVSPNRSIMDNLQDMSACCDCLIRYNEIESKWGVITQKPTYTIAMAIDDSNMVSSIQITPLDIAGTYNVIECKFPDETNQDSFNTATFDLAQLDPSLLYPNEPVNKQSVSLAFVNNDVRAQYLANRMLKASREDLQVQVQINYVGIQLESGDVVTITSPNYGWVDKEFRVLKVTENFAADGSITANLVLTEFNASIYNDVSVTQFQPSPNTGIGNPLIFGTIPTPQLGDQYPSAPDPYFQIIITTPPYGIVQYAEIWYSAFSSPTTDQLIFVGTSQIQSNGSPWDASIQMPSIDLNLPAGDWYFFTRMVNSLGSSSFSAASAKLTWRPNTFQYENRYLIVAYADSIAGSGITSNPRNKTYYGLANSTTNAYISDPTQYKWFLANPAFSTNNYILFCNRTNRKVTLSVGTAGFINSNGTFVPTDSATYDQTIWSALEDGTNAIDLDSRTGQLTKLGTTAVSSADGLLSVSNNTSGTMVVSLQKFLNFGSGVYSKTVAPANITIDVYGRVVGFTQQDDFYFTETVFTATAGQTVFTVSHIVGQILIFRDGILVPTSEFTETTTNFTLTNACAVGEKIVVLNMRVTSYDDFYAPLEITIASSTTNTITYDGLPIQNIASGDVLSFANTGTPSTFTVSSINTTTKVITFTGTISGATAGNSVYSYRASGASYRPFSRYTENVTAITSLTPTTYYINNGYEQIYVNGVGFNEVDYDLANNTLNGFASSITGQMDIIVFTPNNLGVPCSNITNTVAYSTAGATTYVFASNPLAMEVYANGVLLTKGTGEDYTASSGNYVLTTAYDNNYTLLNQQTFARIGAA